MIDRVEFRAPVGLIGRTVDLLVLETYLHKLIVQRNELLKAELEAPVESSRSHFARPHPGARSVRMITGAGFVTGAVAGIDPSTARGA